MAAKNEVRFLSFLFPSCKRNRSDFGISAEYYSELKRGVSKAVGSYHKRLAPSVPSVRPQVCQLRRKRVIMGLRV